jgi:putative ABC transport system permease protein
MNSVAFKMLIGNRAAFFGVIFGIFLAILLISQQSAIFLGLISRSYRMVTDITLPNIWVMDPHTHGEDLVRPMPQDYLAYVKNIPQIEWAVPIYHLELPLTSAQGVFKMAEVYGIDDSTLVGAPKLLQGNLQDLHREGGIILDANSAEGLLAKPMPNGTTTPLTLGDRVEINGQRAVVIGIAKVTPGFYPQPIVFMLGNQFQKFSGSNRFQFIAAKTLPGADVGNVLQQINAYHKVLGLTPDQLAKRIADHFLKTGILINFGLSVALGLIIGFSITGQIFYIMTIHNLSYYALIKALGGTRNTIMRMIALQALVVGIIGYLLGTAATLLWGFAIKNTTLAFEFPWQLLVFTALFALSICIFTVSLSIQKVLKLDPKILMNL